jgi:predicted nucleic acid-binding Zn ribbon protein
MAYICYANITHLYSIITIYKCLKGDYFMDNNLNNCILCGKKVSGRSDKKFCNEYCRNQYNNQKNTQNEVWVKTINSILKKNRKIIFSLLQDEEKKNVVTAEKLRLLHFDFRYYTHNYTTQKGTIYYFCYEYGYLLLDNDKVLLVKRDPV